MSALIRHNLETRTSHNLGTDNTGEIHIFNDLQIFISHRQKHVITNNLPDKLLAQISILRAFIPGLGLIQAKTIVEYWKSGN